MDSEINDHLRFFHKGIAGFLFHNAKTAAYTAVFATRKEERKKMKKMK